MKLRELFLPLLGLAALACLGCAAGGVAVAKASAGIESDEKATKPKLVKIGGINWYVDYDSALQVAKQKKKPMWLHFGENPG